MVSLLRLKIHFLLLPDNTSFSSLLQACFPRTLPSSAPMWWVCFLGSLTCSSGRVVQENKCSWGILKLPAILKWGPWSSEGGGLLYITWQRRRWWYHWSTRGGSWHSFAHLDDKWISTAVIHQKGVEIRSTEASEMKIGVMPTGKPSTQQRQWLRMRQSRMGCIWWILPVVPSAWAPTAYSQGYNLSLSISPRERDPTEFWKNSSQNLYEVDLSSANGEP